MESNWSDVLNAIIDLVSDIIWYGGMVIGCLALLMLLLNALLGDVENKESPAKPTRSNTYTLE